MQILYLLLSYSWDSIYNNYTIMGYRESDHIFKSNLKNDPHHIWQYINIHRVKLFSIVFLEYF